MKQNMPYILLYKCTGIDKNVTISEFKGSLCLVNCSKALLGPLDIKRTCNKYILTLTAQYAEFKSTHYVISA